MGLLPNGGPGAPARSGSGAASWSGWPDGELRELRGNEIAMVFQDALAALNPVMTRRRPARRGDARPRLAARAPAQRRRPSSCSTLVGIPSPGPPGRAVSAPVLGRHAAAGGDRDGDRQRAGAADRRRAHHRARCDGPGAGARGAARGPGADRRHGHADHPRPRCRRRDRRPRAGHVRRQRVEDGPVDRFFYEPRTRTRGLLASLPRHATAGRRAALPDRRPAAGPARLPPGLPRSRRAARASSPSGATLRPPTRRSTVGERPRAPPATASTSCVGGPA